VKEFVIIVIEYRAVERDEKGKRGRESRGE